MSEKRGLVAGVPARKRIIGEKLCTKGFYLCYPGIRPAKLALLKTAVLFLFVMTVVFGGGAGVSHAEDYECDNQNLINLCVAGCSATEGACEGLCGAAETTCKAGCTVTSGVCGGVCGAAETTCKAGCTATSAVCNGLCGAAIDTCKGLVYAGCNTAFGVCKWGPCEEEYDNCIAGGYDGCEADCDGCILDCKDGCEADCDACQLPCESECEADCDACSLPCEEDCQFPCRQVGEGCVPIDPGFGQKCADGLTCVATLGLINDNAYTCFPSDTDDLIPDDTCRSFHVEDLHKAAIDLGNAMNFGAAGAGAVGVGTSTEVGVVYGPDGRFGCYFTECWGGTTDIEAALSGCAGLYTTYDNFKGIAEVIVEEAGCCGGAFSTMQVLNLPEGELIGTGDCFSLEISLAPFSVGYFSCSTIVDTVGTYDPATGEFAMVLNNPPVASCRDITTCADSVECYADANIDNGSYDPDGDPISFDQYPAAPYDIGERLVTLTVDDQNGATASCNGYVSVEDCTPPEITCPDSIVSECESDRQAVIDPGNATATDSCSLVTVNDPGPASYPLGDTVVTYTAEDTWANSASCSMTVSIIDTTAPEISCNAADIVPPDTPISFTAGTTDTCDTASVSITGFECFKFTKSGKKVDKAGSCVVAVESDTITILDSGGVDNNISWTAVATDASGNISTKECSITVQNPGKTAD